MLEGCNESLSWRDKGAPEHHGISGANWHMTRERGLESQPSHSAVLLVLLWDLSWSQEDHIPWGQCCTVSQPHCAAG